MEVEFEIKGMPELKKDFERVNAKIKDGSIIGLIGRAALAVERQAKINASGRPGPRVQSNRLRSSITTGIESYTQAKVGTNVYYAPYVEFGHANRVGKERIAFFFTYAMRPRTPAYPFLYPAVEQCKGQLEGICVTYGKEIEGEWT